MQTETESSKPRTGRPRSGHVYRHGDHWDIRIRLADGRRGKPQHLAATVTEAEARKLAADASEKARTPEPSGAAPAVPGETSDAWLDRWTADRTARGFVVAEETPGSWHKWISPVIARVPMREVSREQIERIVDRLDLAMRNGVIRPATAEKHWATLKAAFRDATSAKNRSLRVRLDNPTDGVRGPEAGVQRSKPWLYPCEFSALMACEAIPRRWRRLFAVATYLYLRASEVAALAVDDVDLVGGVVLVHRSAIRAAVGPNVDATKPTKTTVTHRVPIEASLRPLLAVLVAEARAEGRTRLFVMPPLSELPDQLRRYMPWAGLTRAVLFANDATRAPLTFHDLRATGITWRAVRGDHPVKIQRAVGHLSLETTERYIREAEVIGRAIGEPFPPLPETILATNLPRLETLVAPFSTNEGDPGAPPIAPRLRRDPPSKRAGAAGRRGQRSSAVFKRAGAAGRRGQRSSAAFMRASAAGRRGQRSSAAFMRASAAGRRGQRGGPIQACGGGGAQGPTERTCIQAMGTTRRPG